MGKPMTRRNQDGYSMIELLVIVAIVGILLGISIPGLRSFGRSSGLKDNALQITTDLWLARQKAIATSSPHSIRFDSDQNQYIVFVDDGGADPANSANGILDEGEQVLLTRRLSEEYHFGSIDLDPDQAVIFIPKGTLREGTGGGQISIANDRSQVTILVRPSGLCRIE